MRARKRHNLGRVFVFVVFVSLRLRLFLALRFSRGGRRGAFRDEFHVEARVEVVGGAGLGAASRPGKHSARKRKSAESRARGHDGRETRRLRAPSRGLRVIVFGDIYVFAVGDTPEGTASRAPTRPSPLRGARSAWEKSTSLGTGTRLRAPAPPRKHRRGVGHRGVARGALCRGRVCVGVAVELGHRLARAVRHHVPPRRGARFPHRSEYAVDRRGGEFGVEAAVEPGLGGGSARGGVLRRLRRLHRLRNPLASFRKRLLGAKGLLRAPFGESRRLRRRVDGHARGARAVHGLHVDHRPVGDGDARDRREALGHRGARTRAVAEHSVRHLETGSTGSRREHARRPRARRVFPPERLRRVFFVFVRRVVGDGDRRVDRHRSDDREPVGPGPGPGPGPVVGH